MKFSKKVTNYIASLLVTVLMAKITDLIVGKINEDKEFKDIEKDG